MHGFVFMDVFCSWFQDVEHNHRAFRLEINYGWCTALDGALFDRIWFLALDAGSVSSNCSVVRHYGDRRHERDACDAGFLYARCRYRIGVRNVVCANMLVFHVQANSFGVMVLR